MPQLGQKVGVSQAVAQVDVAGHLGTRSVHHVQVEKQVLALGFLLADLLQPWNHFVQVSAAPVRRLFLWTQRLLGSVELLVSEEGTPRVEAPEKLKSMVGSVYGVLPSLSLLQFRVEILFVAGKHIQLDVSFLRLRNLNVELHSERYINSLTCPSLSPFWSRNHKVKKVLKETLSFKRRPC